MRISIEVSAVDDPREGSGRLELVRANQLARAAAAA